MNENNKKKYKKCLKLLKKSNFRLVEKNRSSFAESIIDKKMKGVFNFTFEKR